MKPAPKTVAVAFSGGRDSLALLHATVHAAAAAGDLQVVALHVHHGLQAEADAWVKSAQSLCARWRRRGLPLRLCWQRVAGQPQPGDSSEAWARRQRYLALSAMARQEGAGLVLLAHHRRDQAETVLLQALRGAGPRGLAAMPASVVRGGITWARPWLKQPREAIDAYVQRHRLRPIEDPSNQDPRLARNRLRLTVWPALLAAFADAESALVAVARHAHQADAAMAELAQLDLHGAVIEGRLVVMPIRALSPARQINALRQWLTGRLPRGVPQSLLQRLMTEALSSRSGRWPAGAGQVIRLQRGCLDLVPEPCPDSGPQQRHLQGPLMLDLSQPGWVDVPEWSGRFEVVCVDACSPCSIPAQSLSRVELRSRRGGERFQRAPRALSRGLKKQYQSAGIGEAGRSGPLVWQGERLVFAPGLGIDARCWAELGQPRLNLRWHAALG